MPKDALQLRESSIVQAKAMIKLMQGVGKFVRVTWTLI